MNKALLNELETKADHLGYVRGSKSALGKASGVDDVHGELLSLKNAGRIRRENFDVTGVDEFSLQLAGYFGLHERVRDHLRGKGRGELNVDFAELAQQLDVLLGDVHEAVIQLGHGGDLRVTYSEGNTAQIRVG